MSLPQINFTESFDERRSNTGAKYFKADDDELLEDSPGVDEQAPLSWRQDPESTHSDWTIVIQSEGVDNIYHVHKNVLSVGPRSCAYFSALFSSELSEQQDQTSRITLDERDANVFPVMLDFIYSPSGELHASTENVVALRSLARYFRCRELMKNANEFLQMDLSVNTAIDYLLMASECNDEKVEESARMLILENYTRIESEKLVALPVELFRSIVCTESLNDKFLLGTSPVSRHVVLFFEANPDSLNARLLHEMTRHLPASVIAPSAAKGFRELIRQLDPQKEDMESWLALDALCTKCARLLARGWTDLDAEQCMEEFRCPRFEGDFYGSGRMAVSLLGEALEQAKSDHNRDRSLLQQRDQKIGTLQDQLARKDQEIGTLQDQLARKDRKIGTFQDQLARKDKEIGTLKDQLARKDKDKKKAKTDKVALQRKEQKIKSLQAELATLAKENGRLQERAENAHEYHYDRSYSSYPRDQRNFYGSYR